MRPILFLSSASALVLAIGALDAAPAFFSLSEARAQEAQVRSAQASNVQVQPRIGRPVPTSSDRRSTIPTVQNARTENVSPAPDGKLIVLSAVARIARGQKNTKRADAQVRQIAAQFLAEIGASEDVRRSLKVTTGGIDIIYLRGLTDQQVEALQGDPRVAYIDPEVAMEIDGTDTAPANWGSDRIDQVSLPLDNRHDYVDASSIHVYILDTGVDATHPEFGGRVVEQQNFSAETDQTCDNHGTYSASFAAGATRGIARNARIHDIKTSGCQILGTNLDFAEGVNHVINTKTGPSVINFSASFEPGYPQSVNATALAALNANIAFVTSSGNKAGSACLRGPNGVPDILTVAASRSNDKWAPFSNHGGCVDVIAPGELVDGARVGGGYGTVSGTSESSPIVAGIAASIWSENPGWSAVQVMQSVIDRAIPNVVTNLPPNTVNKLAHFRPAAGSGGTGGTGGAGGTTNQPPIAFPKTNVFFATGGQPNIQLDATQSSDPDGHLPLTYQWTQTLGTPAPLSNPYSANPTFTAPQVTATETLNFELKVTDSLGAVSVQQALLGIQVTPQICSPYHQNQARVLDELPIATFGLNGAGTVQADLSKIRVTMAQLLASAQAANSSITSVTIWSFLQDMGNGAVPNATPASINGVVGHSVTQGPGGFVIGTSTAPASDFWTDAALQKDRWYVLDTNLSMVGGNNSYSDCAGSRLVFRLPRQPYTSGPRPTTQPLQIFDGKTGSITTLTIAAGTRRPILREAVDHSATAASVLPR